MPYAIPRFLRIHVLVIFLCSFFPKGAFPAVQTFGLISDIQGLSPNNAMIRASLLKSRIKHLIMAGDQLANPRLSYEEFWRPWSGAGFIFDAVALGNHFTTREEEMRFFGMPREYYSTSTGLARFLVLNSDDEETAREQAHWLDRELEDSSEQFRFVVFHHPPYAVSDNHGPHEKPRFHAAISPVLWKHKPRITAVLVGHAHIASIVEMNELPFVFSGATSFPIKTSKVDYIHEGLRVRTRWLSGDGAGWTRLDLNSETGEVWLNFVDDSRDHVRCSALISRHGIQLLPHCR